MTVESIPVDASIVESALFIHFLSWDGILIMVVVYNIPLRIVLLLLSFAFLAAKRKPPSGTRSTATTAKSLSAIENWRIYPVRSQDEAAVIEYGHSAIISALDAAVAHFGPQTTQAALLEVETMPVLADPVDGVGDLMNDEPFKTSPAGIRLLDNADELHGNVAVMTDVAIQKKNNKKNAVGGGSVLTGLDLALMAQASGAAALMLVHVDESRPDDMYRLEIPPGREEEAASIDIPIVVISLASATVLTTATVPDDNVRPEDIVNNGMPDR